MTIRDILSVKGSSIHTISKEVTVLDATQKMNQYKIGALVVQSEEGTIVGMFTERDVLRRVVAEQRMPAEVTVGEVMTTEIVCCTPDTEIDDASAIMKDRRVRHLPVLDEASQLIGLISIGDLNAAHASTQESTIHFLNDYIYGRV